MSKNNTYWGTCIDELLGDLGIELGDKREEFIKGVMSIAEMESEACGDYFIPNPLSDRVRELEDKIKVKERSFDRIIHGIKKRVAESRNVAISDVTIDNDGYIEYSK